MKACLFCHDWMMLWPNDLWENTAFPVSMELARAVPVPAKHSKKWPGSHGLSVKKSQHVRSCLCEQSRMWGWFCASVEQRSLVWPHVYRMPLWPDCLHVKDSYKTEVFTDQHTANRWKRLFSESRTSICDVYVALDCSRGCSCCTVTFSSHWMPTEKKNVIARCCRV